MSCTPRYKKAYHHCAPLIYLMFSCQSHVKKKLKKKNLTLLVYVHTHTHTPNLPICLRMFITQLGSETAWNPFPIIDLQISANSQHPHSPDINPSYLMGEKWMYGNKHFAQDPGPESSDSSSSSLHSPTLTNVCLGCLLKAWSNTNSSSSQQTTKINDSNFLQLMWEFNVVMNIGVINNF